MKSTDAKPLQPYQQRVVEEKIQLDERLGRLVRFIEADPVVFNALPEYERGLMLAQRGAMEQYQNFLRLRIEAFTA